MRQPNLQPPVKLNTTLPADLRLRLDAFLSVDGKVPFGAYNKFLIELITEYLATHAPDDGLR